MQVAQELGDKIKIIKIDTEKNIELSSQLRVRACWGQSPHCQSWPHTFTSHVGLQIEGLPTMVFVGMNKEKPALRTGAAHTLV